MIGKFFLHDNGRIANALLVIAYGAFGVPGHQWFALVSGVLMLGVLWALVASALKRAGLTAPRGLALLVGATAAALLFLATPDPYKAFYWPASSVSHTVAPVLACAAVIPLLRARTRRGRDFALGVAYLAGVFIGTLSEETSIVVFVVLAAVLLLSRWALPGAAGPVRAPGAWLASPGSPSGRPSCTCRPAHASGAGGSAPTAPPCSALRR